MEKYEAIAFCDQWLASWKGKQPDKLIGFYAPDAFYSDPHVNKGLKGHDQILPYFRKLLSKNPDWEWIREELFMTEIGFTLKWKAVIPIHGHKIIEYGVDIIEVENNTITRNEVYFDRTQLLNAMKRNT